MHFRHILFSCIALSMFSLSWCADDLLETQNSLFDVVSRTSSTSSSRQRRATSGACADCPPPKTEALINGLCIPICERYQTTVTNKLLKAMLPCKSVCEM